MEEHAHGSVKTLVCSNFVVHWPKPLPGTLAGYAACAGASYQVTAATKQLLML
jgi:hypothetical protein